MSVAGAAVSRGEAAGAQALVVPSVSAILTHHYLEIDVLKVLYRKTGSRGAAVEPIPEKELR